MGCSASRPANFVTQNQNPNSNSSSSLSNSQLQSPYCSFSDPSSTPVSRTLSLPTPLVHHPPLKKGDSNHFVALTSTTYGSLMLIDSPTPQQFADPTNQMRNGQDSPDPTAQIKRGQDLVSSEDPLSPDSVINTWELMEGLDDEGLDLHRVDAGEIVKSCEFVDHQVSKPLWKHLSEESLLAKMDFNVVSSYQKALLGRQRGREKLKDMLMKPEKNEPLDLNNPGSLVEANDESCRLLGAEDRIVVYYTSLRGIRKTYEDCCSVRVIFRGFRVCVDERDISMDRSYRVELQEALGQKSVSLPQVFVRGRYIGGAEEIKQLNEAGELVKLLEGFPLMDLGCACDVCGDARFVPCRNCNGSRKVYEKEGKLRRCPECNENGLIRCLGCCP